MSDERPTPRLATPDDAATIARLLIDFNNEFESPTQPPEVLEPRLRRLLAAGDTFAVLAGEPSVAIALVTLRTNVWYDGLVALLDELYVEPSLRSRGIGADVLALMNEECDRRGVSSIEINVDADDVDAQRFYEREGFSGVDLDSGERAFYYCRETGA